MLAVTAGNSVRLISPSGQAQTLVRAAGIGPAAWSPGGSALAVATGNASASTLASYPVAGGRSTTWLCLRARDTMNYLIDPAGWWPQQGIGFWALTTSSSLNADQDPFYVIPAPGAHPRSLGNTLAGNGLDQVAEAPGGRLAIVAEVPGAGFGRLIWQGRRVKVCGPAAACTAVPSPPGAVTLDPAWSPGGTTLAFVRAPTRASPGFPQPVVARWYGAHQLWLYDPATRSVSRLDAPVPPSRPGPPTATACFTPHATASGCCHGSPAGRSGSPPAVPAGQLAHLLRAGQLDGPVRLVVRPRLNPSGILSCACSQPNPRRVAQRSTMGRACAAPVMMSHGRDDRGFRFLAPMRQRTVAAVACHLPASVGSV